MPIVYSNPVFPSQQGSNPANQAYVVQTNAGQMLREVCGWNPSVDPQTALRFLNNVYRMIISMRMWYGLKVRGQISVPNPYTTGTCTVTNGSNIVQGIGTAWTPTLVGQQFRLNFTYPYATIQSVNVTAQTMVIDFPFSGNTQTSGYQILAAYFAMDGNITYIQWAINQLMGWPMVVNIPVEEINSIDVWRTYQGWSTQFAVRPPTPSGQYQIEIWPSPFQQQTFPFEAYSQPPDMQLDTDAPVAFIRSDILVSGATAQALLYRPKQNTYYDPQSALMVAREKKAECMAAIEQMAFADNALDDRDISWDYNGSGVSMGSMNWAQSHDV